MANLTFTEKKQLEKILGMATGYVLDFSNTTLSRFVLDATGKNIYDEKYNQASGSKANRLRAFFALESNALVGKLIGDLLEYRRTFCEQPGDEALSDEGLRIVRRLTSQAPGHDADLNAAAIPLDTRDAGGRSSDREPGASAPRLSWQAIAELHEGALDASVTRAGLLAGVNSALVARLDIASSPKEQLLLDLHALNRAGRLTDGTDPLEVWLRNAEILSTPLEHSRIFARYLRQIPNLAKRAIVSGVSLSLVEASDIIQQTAATRQVAVRGVHPAPVSPFGTASFCAHAADGVGVVYCHATGYRKGHAFYVRKGIGWFYEHTLGGSSSPLGLPTSNEEHVDGSNDPVSFFEGGRIAWSRKTRTARATLTQDDGGEVLLAEEAP